MKLSDFLDEELILPKLTARTKPEVLAELIAPLQKKWPDLDLDYIQQVLLEREALGSTGIGNGIAIPHGKFDCLEHILLVAGRSEGGVDFASMDQAPAHIFFLILAPEQVAGMHLRILASVSRLLQDGGFRQAYMESETQEELWQLLKNA